MAHRKYRKKKIKKAAEWAWRIIELEKAIGIPLPRLSGRSIMEGDRSDGVSHVIASVAANHNITVDELKAALTPKFLEKKLNAAMGA